LPQPRPDPTAGRGIAIARAAMAAVLAVLSATGRADDAADFGRAEFTDRREPPARRALPAAEQAAFDFGLLVFNTPWVAADTAGAARRDGLGPLFVSTSCDACHNNGARGRPPTERGGLSNSFVMQLAGAQKLYGSVLNTAALPDHSREGQVEVRWTERRGRYTDSTGWVLHEPHYSLTHLLYGPPPHTTVLRPRVAPALFGAGLLEAVPQAALRKVLAEQSSSVRGELPTGRFGWQAEVADIEDQTARAFAREMGLTSAPRPQDDCSAMQLACRNAPQGGAPEVSADFLHAVLTYQRELAVPARRVPPREAEGRALFQRSGCSACHVESLPVQVDGTERRIDAYTDLLLHDLGAGLADRRVDGRSVRSRWRTAPLWGLAYARRFGEIALLHDGRAASIEEAILWHGGQAEGARRAFLALTTAERALLTEWVGSL
jgi:CxxC motif-containing protein (DUF1111 family)